MRQNAQLRTQSESQRDGLGFVSATGLAITIVVGSGALVVPGIAYLHSGRNALWGWVISAVLMVPLLILFAQLGRALPGAAGIAGFVQAAFGRRAAAATEMLIIGTFGIGTPAIALAGGHYLAATGPLPAAAAPWGAAAMVIAGTAINLLGVRLSGGVQGALAALLAIGLLTTALCGLFLAPSPQPGPELSFAGLFVGLQTVVVVFFAFTGWELVTFTTGEYANPKRDFPRVVATSYVITVALYLLLAFAVQFALPAGTNGLDSRPIERMIEIVVNPAVAQGVSAVGAVMLLANVIGSIWAASRLAMSSSQEGLLPQRIGRTDRSGLPRAAILACGGWFLGVVAANGLGWIPLSGLLILAGKNFFLLYLLSALAHFKLFGRASSRIIAGGTIVLFAVPMLTFGWASLAYPGALLALGLLLGWTRRPRHDREGYSKPLVTLSR
jgi:amino acid efflux transporter